MSHSEFAIFPGQLSQIACIMEATARKPGNVHRFRDFDDTHYLDFLLSASAIAGALDRARETGLGLTIFRCVEATRRLVGTNTNLGMILLLAPLAMVPLDETDLRNGVSRILASTTVEDASHVYRAIRMANPGGLGKVEDQDVESEPTITLREAMALAADRDQVARQYVTDFATVFEKGLVSLKKSVKYRMSVELAIISTQLDLLESELDSLILRKRGRHEAAEANDRASRVLELGWPDTDSGIAELAKFDVWLREDGHARNPGATADLTTAALFAALRDGTIHLPLARKFSDEV